MHVGLRRRGKTAHDNTGLGRVRGGSAFQFGAAAGLSLATLTLIVLVIQNPFLVDSLMLALAAFAVLPVLVGGVIGVGLASLVRGLGRRHAGSGSGAAARTARLLVVACLALAVVVCVGGRVASIGAERGPAEPGLRLLLVGVDGATWKIVEPMMAEGGLPNIARLVDTGSTGILSSIIPMYSPRLFTTIATGKTADKHGVQGASDATSDAVLVKRVWDILWEQRDWDYGLVGWYVTSPPVASRDGFVIPGPPAVTAQTIPRELSFVKEIERGAGGSNRGRVVRQLVLVAEAASRGATLTRLCELVGIGLANARGASRIDIYARQHETIVRLATDVTCWQLHRGDVEVVAELYRSTDRLSHMYWRFQDPEAYPDTEPELIAAHGHVIESIYSVVDEQLGRLMRYVSDDGIVVIISDHGFKPKLRIIAEPFSFRTETLLRRLGISLDDLTYVNLGYGFFLQPLAIDEEMNARRRAELEEIFASLVIDGTGVPMFGVRNVDKAGTGDDYVEVLLTRDSEPHVAGDPMVVSPDGHAIRVSEFVATSEVTGVHALDGVIAMCGKPFVPGASTDDATILDVTPTILAALGLPVASDMDGRVLSEVMTAEFLSASPVCAMATYETDVRAKREHEPMDTMTEEMKERLRSVGYIE